MIWRREDAEAEHADRSRDQAPPERKDRQMAENGEVTIVGKDARLEGNVVSAGNLRVDGQIKGQINADGDVVLSQQSQVEADIRSQNVSVAGRFKGNITSKTLVVEEGGVFHGQSIMDAGAGSGSSSPQAAQQSAGAAAKEGEEKQPDQVKV